MLVIDAVTKVAQNVGARVNFLTLMDTANYQLGKGVIGEFPCDEGYSPLTRFAWLRHLPQLMRRVLVAELEYDKKFFTSLILRNVQSRLPLASYTSVRVMSVFTLMDLGRC